MTPMLRVENLCVQLGGAEIVRGVSFSVDPGAWFGMLGANGSGKTTLLRCLAGRLPASGGAMSIRDQDVTRALRDRAELVGYAPAHGTLPVGVTAAELLSLIGRARMSPSNEPRNVFEALDIGPLLNVSIDRMSSGMRQRVSNFAAFIGSRKLLILDEPLNWLDPVVTHDFKAALTQYVSEGNTVITALHDTATFAMRCNGGLVLHGGHVVQTVDHVIGSRLSDISEFERDIYSTLKGLSRQAEGAASSL